MENLKGRTVKGYELLHLIGSGGFGAVYQAHQAIIDREVAIKAILPHHVNDPHFIRNFESEAHLIARLEHPFVVPLYDFWRDSEGAYLVMRYYQQGNLSQLIHQSGAMDYEMIVRMLEQIASALDTAHAANIIHRDIKPTNILLDAIGNAYLSDFGLAEDIANGAESADLVGSPAYVSPEVIQNQQASPQSDLYSLGFVLYEMLTGQYAFAEITPDSSIMSILDFHLNTYTPNVEDLSDSINLVIQRATAKDPLDRYPSAMAMATAFREAISDSGIIPAVISVSSDYIVNPYKGLRAFDEADEFTFFGRDKLVKRLLQRLNEDSPANNFLALVGPSGSGKSSVVYAGLVPAIRRGELTNSEDWFILDMVPGTNPFSQLVAALRSIAIDPLIGAEHDLQASPDALINVLSNVLPRPDDKLMLVIDQFEELFTQTEDNRIRRLFLDLLYQSLASEQLYLVIMLRADFYDRPMLHEDFGELIQGRTQVILPLNSMELNNIITKPAEHAGLVINSDLTTAIIADVQAEAVALPLLQYALTEVFERREENQLTLDSYRAIGGIAGALAHRADEIYNQLDHAHQDIARQLFLRLVTLGEGTEDTRRRAKRSELLSVVKNNMLLQSVLDVFGQARLLTFDNDEETREPTVEVGHEALIREWNLLRDWLDMSRDDIRRQRIISSTVTAWLDANRDRSYLLRGAQLLQIEDWYQQSSIELSDNEKAFIAASIAERERIAAIEQDRLAHKAALEKQSQDRLRIMLAVFAVAAIVGIGLSVFAFTQATTAREAQVLAEDSREEAVQSQMTAEASRLEAETSRAEALVSELEAQESAEISNSLALASSALREYGEGKAQLALALALAAVDVDQAILNSPPELAYDALVEISHAPGLMYEEIVHDRPIEHIDVSPDGRYAIFGSGMNAMRYWGFRGPPPDGAGRGGPSRPSGNPPPQGVALTYDLFIWDLVTRSLLNPLVAHQAAITDIVFVTQADGTALLISASDDGQVIFWDFETQTILDELQTASGFVVLSPSIDGETVLVAVNGVALNEDNTNADEVRDSLLTLVEVSTRVVISEYHVRPDLALARMTEDGVYMIGLHLNGDVITWHSETGETIMSTNIQTPVRPNSFDLLVSPNNQMIAINTGGITIPLFDYKTGQSLGNVVPSTLGTHRATFNDDGSQMLAVSRDGVLTVWDIEGRYFVQDFKREASLPSGVFWQSTHDVAIVTTVAGSLQVYSISGEDVDLVDTIGTQSARQTVWVSDTEVLIVYRRQGSQVVLWNLETGEERIIIEQSPQTYTISLSADKRFIAATTDNHIRLFDVENGEIRACSFCTRPDNSLPMRATFMNTSPNRLAIVQGGALSLVDLETQSQIWDLPPLGAPVNGIVSSDDGTLIVVALDNGLIVILDIETGAELGRYDKGDSIHDVALSPDNRLIAIATKDNDDSNKIYIIEWASGDEVQELRGHDLAVTSLEFLSNGTELVSSSDDTTVIYWDILSGDIINRFPHNLLIYDVTLSPDESTILSTSEDNWVHLWSLDKLSLDEVVAWANENRLVRDFSESECARYSISEICESGSNGE